MPKLRFRALPASKFSVAVSQKGVAPKTYSFPAEPPLVPEETAPVDVTTRAWIEVNRTEGIAPAGFFFSVKVDDSWDDGGDPYFDPYYDLHYKWSFSDPGWYTRHDTDDLPWGRWYDVAGSKVLMTDGTVPKGTDVTFLGNDKNIAYGPHCCHVFAPSAANFRAADGHVLSSKDFRVTCEIRSARTAAPILRIGRTITVLNPDIEFAAERTLLVHPTGDISNPDDPAWRGAPGGQANQRFNTLAAIAQTNLTAFGTKIRVLLACNQEHDGTHTWAGNLPARFSAMQIGAYGDGLPPRIIKQAPSIHADGGVGEGCFWGFDLRGDWDPTDAESVTPESVSGRSGPTVKGLDLQNSTAGAFPTVWDVSTAGTRGLVTLGGQGDNAIISNTYCTKWHTYAIYGAAMDKDGVGGSGHWGLAGVWIKQSPNAFINLAANGSMAPLRVNSLKAPVAFNLLDIRSVGDQSGFYGTWRLGHHNHADGYIEEVVHDRMRFENGNLYSTGLSRSDPSKTDPEYGYTGDAVPRRYLYDKCMNVAANIGGVGGKNQFPGPTYRNCLLLYPDQHVHSKYGRNGEFWLVELGGNKYDPVCLSWRLSLYSNTMVDFRSGKRHPVTDWDSGPEAYTKVGLNHPSLRPAAWGKSAIDNNVVFAPYYEDSDYPDVFLEWQSRPLLYEVNDPGAAIWPNAPDPVYAKPSDTVKLLAPRSGDSPYQDANISGKIAIDDFFGRIRTSEKPSRGAFEPL